MRPALFAAPLLVAVLPLAVAAQTAPYLAATTGKTDLRAGASDKYESTGELDKDTLLVVERDDGGPWLGVRPPDHIGLSWVMKVATDRYDENAPFPQNVVVASSGQVWLAVGRVGHHVPLDEVRSLPVPDGSILKVIGRHVEHKGKTWLPVEPPSGDLRYVPRSAVRPGPPAKERAYAVRSDDSSTPNPASPPSPPPAVGPTASLPASPSLTTSPAPTTNPLWVQAVQAEQAGRFDEAVRRYEDLARTLRESGGADDVIHLCFTRIHRVREMEREKLAGGPVTRTAATTPPPSAADNWQQPRSPVPPPRDDRAMPSPFRDDRTARPVGRDPRDDRGLPPPPGTGGGTERKGPYRLVRSALAFDGQQTFALESASGVVTMYAVGAPGVDLGRYTNRRVDVSGQVYDGTKYRVSKPYMVVSQVEAAP